jgi:hypothetical protein
MNNQWSQCSRRASVGCFLIAANFRVEWMESQYYNELPELLWVWSPFRFWKTFPWKHILTSKCKEPQIEWKNQKIWRTNAEAIISKGRRNSFLWRKIYQDIPSFWEIQIWGGKNWDSVEKLLNYRRGFRCF